MNVLTAPVLTSLSAWFAAIVGALCQAVAARVGQDRAMGPLVLLLSGRLGRLRQRFDTLLPRVAAGLYVPAARLRFKHMLADPAMMALLVEIPAAGRIIRPVCRLLGIRPDGHVVVPGLVARRPKAAPVSSESPVPKPSEAVGPKTWAELIASKPVVVESVDSSPRFQQKFWSQR